MKLKHRILLVIAVLMALASWVIVIYFWDKLPSTIPVHFGISGQADDWANKSLFYVFLIPLVQTIILGFSIFLYYKPQYSDMPTTLWLMTLDKKHREHAFELIRTMLVGISLWVGLLMTYITYGMNISALDSDSRLSPIILTVIIVSMLLWLIYWSIKVYKPKKTAIGSIKNKKNN